VISFEEIKAFLPQYLTEDHQQRLISVLKSFPEKFRDGAYTEEQTVVEQLLQGDGVPDFPIVNLPSVVVKNGKALIISNSCDIATENKREIRPKRLSFCPIVDLTLYESALSEVGVSAQQIGSHVVEIKAQKISNIFYLPKAEKMSGDGIVFFDSLLSIDNAALDRNEIISKKLFTLSDAGWYFLLLKMSIHFTRMNEGVKRGIP